MVDIMATPATDTLAVPGSKPPAMSKRSAALRAAASAAAHVTKLTGMGAGLLVSGLAAGHASAKMQGPLSGPSGPTSTLSMSASDHLGFL